MKKFDISTLMISRIFDIYSYTLKEDSVTEAVSEHCALILKRRGRSYFTVNDSRLVADVNHILFLPAGVHYTMEIDREGECAVIEFDTVDTYNCMDACCYDIANESDILATAKNILHYWDLHGPAYQSKCLSELYNLITQVSTVISYTDSLAGKYRLIHKSVKYIEANYRDPDLYTPALAAMSGIGETYYRSIFQAVFGVPPTRYIQQYRINKAKKLLATDKMQVDEIAAAVGFANASYFCKVFKTITSLTPSEFAQHRHLLG